MIFYRQLAAFMRTLRRPSAVPRRDAYLFTWSVGYILLAFYWVALSEYWGVLFFMAGITSLVGAVSSNLHLKALGFSFLAGTAVLHAFNFIWPFPFSGISLPRPMSLMWLIAAASHVIISGWPAHCSEHRFETESEA